MPVVDVCEVRAEPGTGGEEGGGGGSGEGGKEKSTAYAVETAAIVTATR